MHAPDEGPSYDRKWIVQTNCLVDVQSIILPQMNVAPLIAKYFISLFSNVRRDSDFTMNRELKIRFGNLKNDSTLCLYHFQIPL
jgi:hypothetical protein